ncbi:MAG: IlvD/Edd family dehydratase [Betaproteobacteria bacterium]
MGNKKTVSKKSVQKSQSSSRDASKLRSRQWFNNPKNPDMTALYIERYMNWGISREELQSGKPIIGIAQSGSDLSPCNRHHLELAKRVREGIREAGGIAFEFPVHPIQETGKRPSATLDRNLCYLGLVELLYGYFIDGVVLTTGCDKTTPAQLMAAATVDIPAIVLSGGPMLNGWFRGKRTGSGTIVWEARKLLAAGEINHEQYIEIIASSAPSVGHCNTMGTASTMNALAEAIGMSLPGSAAIPAPHRERAENAYLTGKRIVEMVWEDLRPSKIMTKSAFENMIAVNSAIGGSTNAPIHFNAIAKHLGVKLDNDDWERVGYDVPLIVNMQPAGEYLGEDFHHAGGVPAVVSQLIKAGKINKKATTVNGKSLYQNCEKEKVMDESVIWSTKKPMKSKAGFLNMKGNLFDSAIMKTSVISDSFKEKYLSDPKDPNAFEGRAIVFEGPEDYHKRIDDPKLKIDDRCMLFVRGVGPVGYPGAAEVVNMQPPAKLIRAGVQELPCIGDGRQSGTSGSPSILNASPEAATGGNLAILKTNDIVRIDLNKRSVDIKISKTEIEKRHRALKKKGGHPIPESQTPWQEIQREIVDELSEGMVLKPAVKYQKIDRKKGVPRDNH